MFFLESSFLCLIFPTVTKDITNSTTLETRRADVVQQIELIHKCARFHVTYD